MATQFQQVKERWNAEPNAPDPIGEVDDSDVVLAFFAIPFQLPRFAEEQRLRVRFTGARKYRLGSTNDEGWYRGQCRFSGEAPAWGEFCEVSGDFKLDQCPTDWHRIAVARPPCRHFLFYLRDHTFECEADDWVLDEGAVQPTVADGPSPRR